MPTTTKRKIRRSLISDDELSYVRRSYANGQVERAGIPSQRDLDRYVRLIFFAMMNIAKDSDELLQARKLWRNHHRVLATLSTGDAHSLSELAVRNGTSKQALQKSIAKLAMTRMVKMEVNPLNRRAMSVKITPEGRKFRSILDKSQQEGFAKATEGVEPADLAAWERVMMRLVMAEAE